MTVSDHDCPATSVLESIAQGASADAAIEAHVAHCPRCSEYLALARFSLRFGAVLGGDSVRAPQPEGSPNIHGYRICEEIARGGQGVIYRAEQTLTGKIVAIKVLHSISNATARARLHREMQIIAGLDHPVIVGLHDSVRLSDGREALVMEYISGTPITQWSDRQQPDLGTRLRVLAEVAEGLHHAHERGVVHRDLTPSNILIDQLGNPRLLDFGVARLLAGDTTQSALTRTGEFTGTLAYSAPEQVSGEIGSADARSDIYSLGVIGYRVLAGEMPYAVDGPLEEVIRSITEHDPPPRSRSGLGADPWTVLQKAMQKDPKRRYETAAAFAQDLRSAADGRAIEARGASRAYRLTMTLRKQRRPIAAALVFLLAAMVIIAVSSQRIDRTDRARARSELATMLATGSRERAQSLLWEELDRVTPSDADPLRLMWDGDSDTRSLVWAFAEMQSEALCLAADDSFASAPLSITTLDSGEFGIITADRTVYRGREDRTGLVFVSGPRLDPAIRFARFVPDRDWIAAVTSSEVRVLDSVSGEVLSARPLDQSLELAGMNARSETLVICGVRGQLEVYSLPDLLPIATLAGIAGGQSDWIDAEEAAVWFLNEDGALCRYRIADSSTTVHGFRVPIAEHQYVAEIQILPSRGMAVIAHAGKVLAGFIDGPASAPPIVLHSGYRVNLGLSPGSRVLSGQSTGDSTLRLWDLETWQPVGGLSGHSGSVLFSAMSRDGRRCMTADSSGIIRLWALPGGDWRTDLPDDGVTVHEFGLGADGARLFLPAGDKGVRTIDLHNPDNDAGLWEADFDIARVVVHPRGHLLAATDLGRTIRIRSTDADARTDVKLVLDPGDTIAAARFSASSDDLYIATQSGDLLEIDCSTGVIRRRSTVASEGRVSDLVIDPRGESMALGTRAGALVLIDPKTLAPVHLEQISEKQIRALCFDPSGKAVYCVGDTGRIHRLDLRTKQARSSELISQASLFEVAVHPAGHTLAVGDRNGIVRIIDAATLQPLCKLRGSGSVMALSFIAAGDRMVVSCLEQPPQVWDLTQLVSPLSMVRPGRGR